MIQSRRLTVDFLLLAILLIPLATSAHGQGLQLKKGDRICLIGNALAERMQHDGWLETLIQSRFPEQELVFRNLGFSGDEVTTRLRSAGFGSPDDWLRHWKASVVFAFFGYNESFAGAEGLERFKQDLENFIKHTLAQKYNGESAARLVLFSPIAFEDLNNPNLPDGTEHNSRIELYTKAMADVAKANNVPFVDLFAATRRLYQQSDQPLTINGLHLNQQGNKLVAAAAAAALFPRQPPAQPQPSQLEKLRQAVVDKNFFWFHRYRTTDGYNVFGGRSKLAYPDKTTNRKITNYEILQREMKVLDVMTSNRDGRVWAIAQGKGHTVDDSNTPPFISITTNKPGPLEGGLYQFLGGEDAIAKMTVAKGMKVNLFADERMFPELINAVQMAFDTQGRLWVASWPSYPHWKPKDKMDDRLLILEDTDGDGRADRCKTFATGLHSVTGFEFWGGGVIVAMAPDLLFLKDTDGDDKADVRERILHGIDSADTHHAANSLTFDPGGALYFQEGTFHQSQIETLRHGSQRNNNGCVWRFNPRTWEVNRHVPYNFANPHGHVYDRWGNGFVHDGTGARPWHEALFSGHLDFPAKHPAAPQLYQQRTRPCPGTEILSSRHFPEKMQGNLLVANVIGFLGILQYRIEPAGASYRGVEVEPILTSTDPNFRPADMEIGADGALYFTDWQNPIIGHMQHHLRDPSRDQKHGRVYRVTFPDRPLLKPAKIAGEPIEKLIELLKSPENRARYRAKIELSKHDSKAVISAVRRWADKLDKGDPNHQHQLMEALWGHQHHNVVNEELLRRMLRSPDHRARTAATRVLCYWHDRVNDPLGLLLPQAEDEHPRVRLEAVRAASFFREAKAAEVALAALKQPSDQYLNYTLGETMKQLEPFWKKAIAEGASLAADNPAGVNYLLRSVSTAELVKLPRTTMVYQALLSRPNILHDHRHEALMALAKANKTNMTTELLAAIGRLDKTGSPDARLVLFDLAHMFTMRPQAEFEKHRATIEKLATSARLPITRRMAYVTLITADKSIEGVWRRGAKSPRTLRELVGTVPLIPDAKLRAAAHPKVAPLLDGLPEPLAKQLAGKKGTSGRYVRIELPGRRKTLTLAEVEVFSDGGNVARGGKASQSATAHGGVASRAIDGNTSGSYGSGGQTHTPVNRRNPWWEVDLGAEQPIESIVVWNRTDGNLGNRLGGFTIKVLDASRQEVFAKTGVPAPSRNVKFELDGDPAGAIQRAAINAITYTGVQPAETFAKLARFVRENKSRAAAVRALSRIPRRDWPEEEIEPLIGSILARVGQLPAKERTSPAVLDELALGNSLATSLPRPKALKARKALRELGVNVIRLRPVPHKMQYDRAQIFVEAGKPVEIVFENIDIMPHNLVITAPGSFAKVGIAAEAMATQPDAFAKEFVPDLKEVLHASRLLQPSQVQRLSFTAPRQLGEYPFICTYPGHWRRMYGTMHVVADLDAVPREAFAPASDPEIQTRPFVRAWKLEELQGDLKLADRGRSFERGKALFTSISCVQCHRMNGTGGQVGPDLIDVKKKLAMGEFKRIDILQELIEPSKKIDKKYQTVIIQDANGRLHTGIVVARDQQALQLAANPLEKKKPVTIRLAEIEQEVESKISMMPQGLLNTLTKEEILDLLAFIESGGDPKHRAFQKEQR